MFVLTTISSIIHFHEALDRDLRSDPAIRDIHRLYDSITVKNSSLLQHQSVMIAACTFLANIPGTERYIKFLFLAGTFAYMILCLATLPVLNVSTYDSPSVTSERRIYFARSIRRRVNVLTLNLRATTILTMIVIATLAVDLYIFGHKIL